MERVDPRGATVSRARWLGVAALVLGVIAMVAFAVATSSLFWQDRNVDLDFLAFGVFVTGLIASLSTATVGLILGTVGLLKSKERRLWSVMGTSVSIAVLFGWLCLRIWW